MPDGKDLEAHLRNLAFLYLAMGHGTDNYLSNAELSAITDRLHARHPTVERSVVQDIVGEAMAVYMETTDFVRTATEMIAGMRSGLSEDQRSQILEDLVAVAEADGVVLQNERGLLTALAETWGLTPPHGSAVEDEEETSSWDVLHYLALIYLVLAHGTDNELSDSERAVMLKKLQEWAPRHDEQEVADILQVALARYAKGVPDDAFTEAVHAVRDGMPQGQRMAALDDLVKIANADGVFLDREEDLINQLLSAWQVEPQANYERQGKKSDDRS